LNINRKLYFQTYKSARNWNEQMVYTSHRHAQELAKHGYDEEKIYQALEKTEAVEFLKQLIIKDAESFLTKIKDLGQPMILLSSGESGFQNIKIKRTELDKYFDQILITRKPKEQVLDGIKELAEQPKIWFVNNRVDETLAVKDKFDWFKYVLKQSEDISLSEYQSGGLPFFPNLTQIYEFIIKS